MEKGGDKTDEWEYEMSDKGRGAGGGAVIMSDNQRIETDTFSH